MLGILIAFLNLNSVIFDENNCFPKMSALLAFWFE